MNQSANRSGKTVDGPQQSKSNRSGGGVFATGLQWQRIKECVLTSKITLLSKSVGACMQWRKRIQPVVRSEQPGRSEGVMSCCEAEDGDAKEGVSSELKTKGR
jgi:hypothetical protein